MKELLFLVIIITLITYATPTVKACDYCIASQGISPVELGSSGIRYDLRYLHLGDIFKDGVKIENPYGIEETYVTHQFGGHYMFSDAFTISVLVPFSSRSALVAGTVGDTARIKGGQQPQHHDTEHPVTRSDYVSGLADIIALVKFRALDENSAAGDPLTLVITAGVKLPTGSTDTKSSTGTLLHPHLQLGTGSTDILAGCSIIKGFDGWTLVATLLGILPTEGANGYKYGVNLNYDLGIRYKFIDNGEVGGSLFGSLSLLGEMRGKEKEHDIELASTGGNTTYIAPGVVYFITDRLSAEASYQHPILHNLNGTQLGESNRISAGAQYLF